MISHKIFVSPHLNLSYYFKLINNFVIVCVSLNEQKIGFYFYFPPLKSPPGREETPTVLVFNLYLCSVPIRWKSHC